MLPMGTVSQGPGSVKGPWQASPGWVALGRGRACLQGGREGRVCPPRAPRDVPRQQAGLGRGWLGRGAWRVVWCPAQAKSPGHQVTEARDRRQDEGAEVCDGPRRPSFPQPGREPPGALSPVR